MSLLQSSRNMPYPGLWAAGWETESEQHAGRGLPAPRYLVRGTSPSRPEAWASDLPQRDRTLRGKQNHKGSHSGKQDDGRFFKNFFFCIACTSENNISLNNPILLPTCQNKQFLTFNCLTLIFHKNYVIFFRI